MDSPDRSAAKRHTTTSYSEAKANELGVNVTRADQPLPPRPEDRRTRPKASAATVDLESVAFTVYGVAQPAGSKRAFQHRHTNRVVVVDDAKGSRPWKTDVAAEAGLVMRGRELLAGPLTLEVVFKLPRPKGHIGAKGNVRPSAPMSPIVKPDLLKLARAVEDAMSGVVYRDDSQIVTELLRKSYTTTQARTEVRVTPHPPP